MELMTEKVWAQFLALAVPGGDAAPALATLDASRTEYHEYYAEIEAIAQSSLHALRPAGGARAGGGAKAVARAAGVARGGGADAVIRIAERVVPRTMLRKVPPVWRARLVRTANRAGRLVHR